MPKIPVEIGKFRVKRTGVELEVGDPATLKRLLASPQDYELIKPEAPKKPEKSG